MKLKWKNNRKRLKRWEPGKTALILPFGFCQKQVLRGKLLSRALEGDAPVTFTNILMGDLDSSKRRNSTSDTETEATLRIEAEERSVPAWWILSTSVVFELVILTFAAFVFIRRDY